MRYLLMFLVVGSTACEAKQEPTSTSRVVPAESHEELLKAVDAAPIEKVQQTPLPENLKLDFPHAIVMETTRETAGVQVHTLMIEPKVAVKDAVALLTKAFEAASFTTTPAGQYSVGFSKGGTGEGMMAVASGGTQVALTFNDYKSDNPRAKDGFLGMINMSISSGIRK